MEKPQAAQAPPLVEVTDIFDPTVANSTFEFFEQDLVQLPSKTSLKARQVIVRLEGVNVVYYSTNVRVRTRPTLQRGYLGFVCFGPKASGTANGLLVKDDALLVAPASQTIAMVADPGYESAAFTVPPEMLVAHLSAQGREETLANLRRFEMRHVDPGLAGRLFEWAKRLIESVVEHAELFDDSVERRIAARHDLLENLSSTLAASSTSALKRRERTRLMQSDIVRAAEQYALAHSSERLYVKDLCQAAGVSERSLEYAFRAEMGLRPTSYLTRIRLHKVREALSKNNALPTTVTNEALAWGFWHFGEFAKAYKECFGELPSDTLRRAQGN